METMQKNRWEKFSWLSPLEPAWPILLFAGLVACGTTTASNAPTSQPVSSPSEFCAIAKPIIWSALDTDETIKEVKEHNATGKALCNWGAPPK